MPPTKITRKKVVKTEHSWLYRHFGTVVFSTLLFSTVAYALTWPTVPGEAGYPIEGSFWNYFEKVLVDTGASSDGTVKKSATLWIAWGRTAILADANGNTGIGTGASAPYTLSVSGQALFNDNVIGATPTASGHFATKGYVDAQVVSAGGGGYGMCYRVVNSTAAYPSCATGYTRSYAAYTNVTWSSPITVNIYFENNIGWAWFQNFWHVYLYYDYDGGSNSIRFYDDQDRQLTSGFHNGILGWLTTTFSSKQSTYMSYTTQSPTTYTTFWSLSNFWYAVCCK